MVTFSFFFRYSISFLNEKKDRAIHISSRFDQDKIVFNTQASREWLTEERTDMFDFARSHLLRVSLLLRDRELKFAINENHLYKFKHGLNLKSLTDLLFEGDVRVHFIKYSSNQNLPVDFPAELVLNTLFSPPVPFYHEFIKPIKPNARFILSGFPRSCRTPVVINLEEGEHRIHFHMSIRLHEKRIVRNTYANGDWQKEEDQLFEFPFDMGHSFDLEIKVFADCFETFVNSEPCFRFHQRLKPVEAIKRVRIVGPIKLYVFRHEE